MDTTLLLTALIVEDDADTRANLCDILQLDGYRTTAVDTAADAIALAREQRFDAIILDRHLPDSTADDLLPELIAVLPEASIIIATGRAEIDRAVEAMRYGAIDYILKPIQPELLRASLRHARELRSAKRQAADAERLAAIGTVVAGVAHESRGALQRIRARVDLIRLLHETDASLLEDLAAIDDASSQLQSHFEELREFSAPVVVHLVECPLKSLIRRVWRNVCCVTAYPNAELLLPDDDIECLMDPMKIEQVFRNLIENSLAAADDSVRVEVTWEADDAAATIRVCDNGRGLSDEQRLHAFDPFFTTKGSGTGLGLSISRRIAQAHGGWLEIDETYHNGAAFELTVPIVARAEQATEEQATEEQATEEQFAIA